MFSPSYFGAFTALKGDRAPWATPLMHWSDTLTHTYTPPGPQHTQVKMFSSQRPRGYAPVATKAPRKDPTAVTQTIKPNRGVYGYLQFDNGHLNVAPEGAEIAM
jgi:hypothetical protein